MRFGFSGAGHTVREVTASDARHPGSTPATAAASARCRLRDVRAGELTRSRGYGLADVARNRPVTNETTFNLGSTSKTISAWAVMALVTSRRIDLDAPVNRYQKRWKLPRSGFDHELATVRRVLSHTAGLSVRSYHGVHVPGDSLPTVVGSLNGYSGSDGAVRVEREPGKSFAYSSGGYTLLQLLVEDVTGEPFSAFVRERCSFR